MVIVGIAGGSGSGKSTLAKVLIEKLDAENVVLISQDWYYKDNGHLSDEEKSAFNYDHPDAIEFELLQKHLRTFRQGHAIAAPQYDFSTHSRLPESLRLEAKKIVIVEGILILSPESLRNMFDLRIFVDADDDIRLARRIKRDISKRGREVFDVLEQYQSTVKPSFDEFIEPVKSKSDIIVPKGGKNRLAADMIVAWIEKMSK